MNKCIHCGTETTNAKFCSRSCTASVNNKLYPKRYSQTKCSVCGVRCRTKRKYCPTCRNSDANPNYVDWSKCTIADLQSKRSFQVNSRIRDLARRVYLSSDRRKGCAICDYDKHYEIHHIVSIEKFDSSTLITTVNHLDNLIALCPNHHWEADNKIIDASFLRSCI